MAIRPAERIKGAASRSPTIEGRSVNRPASKRYAAEKATSATSGRTAASQAHIARTREVVCLSTARFLHAAAPRGERTPLGLRHTTSAKRRTPACHTQDSCDVDGAL